MQGAQPFAKADLLGKASGGLLGGRDKGGGVDAWWALVLVLRGEEMAEQDKHKAPASAPLLPLSLHSMGAICSKDLSMERALPSAGVWMSKRYQVKRACYPGTTQSAMGRFTSQRTCPLAATGRGTWLGPLQDHLRKRGRCGTHDRSSGWPERLSWWR
jgi:hypothetical protein